MDFFDAPVPARDTDTSRDAARSVSRNVSRMRILARDAVRAAGREGLTADEVAERLKLSPLSIRPRVTELNKAGIIIDSGQRRQNASGNNAIVWVYHDLPGAGQ